MAINMQEEMVEDFAGFIKRICFDTVNTLEKLRNECTMQTRYDKSFIDGLGGLIDHTKSGKSLKTSIMPFDDNANSIFKALLERAGIVFTSFQFSDKDTGKLYEMFLTKDTDSRIIETCKTEAERLKKSTTGELQFIDLMNKFEGNEPIYAVHDLDFTEVEYFRREIQENIDYSVSTDMNDLDKYMIVYPEQSLEAVENALDKMIFDFSGQDGHERKKDLDALYEKRKKFAEIVKANVMMGKRLIIADAKNPNILISLDSYGLVLHMLDKEYEKSPDGGERLVLENDDICVFPDYGNLEVYLDNFVEAVMIPTEKVSFIKEFDKDGHIVVDNESFEKDYKTFETLLSRVSEDDRYTFRGEIIEGHSLILQSEYNANEIPADKQKEADEKIKAYKENRTKYDINSDDLDEAKSRNHNLVKDTLYVFPD